MNVPIFIKTKSKCIDNLYVAFNGSQPVGMVHRPKNTRTEKNFWQCYIGVGEAAKFLGHAGNRKEAQNHVLWAYVMANAQITVV